MSVRNLYGVSGQLAVAINSAVTIITVDSTLAGAIGASGFVNGTDSTYFAITANNVYEVVKVTHRNGNNLTVVRAIDGPAEPFPIGSKLNFVVTAAGVLETIGPIASTVQIQDTGMAVVTNLGGDIWNVHVPSPNFNGIGGVSVLGAYPNFTFSYTPSDCCGDEAGAAGAGITSLQATGIATAYASGGIGYVGVPAPAFVGVNVTISGVWPNITFTGLAGGGTGSVTSVGVGPGLNLTGSPTVSPVVNITNTGVVAGVYGGVDINSRGQIVAVPITFNPLSIVVPGTGVTATRLGDSVTIGVADATIGVKGVVQLVDPTDPYDPTNATEALTPAALAVALAGVAAGSTTGASNFSGEADAAYTNTIAGTPLAVELAAGKKAIVHAEVTVVDGTTPLTPIAFGIAIFNAVPARIRADRKITQSKQVLSFLIEGPIAASTWAVLTTALPVGSSVVSYSFFIQKLP